MKYSPGGRLFIALLVLTLAGCGGDEGAGGDAGGDSIAAVGDPCVILSDELIFKHFESARGAEITRSPSSYSPHPLCMVSWEKPDAAEIQARITAGMGEYMRKKAAGEDAKMPSFNTSNELNLTLYKTRFASAGEAEATFDTAMKTLSEGVTASSGDVNVTFQSDVTPVSGVGDKAMWAVKLRQLAVQDDRRIFYLSVNTGSETDQDTAKAIALDIIDGG